MKIISLVIKLQRKPVLHCGRLIIFDPAHNLYTQPYIYWLIHSTYIIHIYIQTQENTNNNLSKYFIVSWYSNFPILQYKSNTRNLYNINKYEFYEIDHITVLTVEASVDRPCPQATAWDPIPHTHSLLN